MGIQLAELNIIEFVWQVMKKRVQEVHPRTIEELKATLRQDWEGFTAEKLDGMITSMPRRIQAVITSNEILTSLALYLRLLTLFL